MQITYKLLKHEHVNITDDNSFLPSVIREWNSLSENTRNASSVNAFKSRPDQNVIAPEIPKYFYIGDRRLQMLHTLFEYIVVP